MNDDRCKSDFIRGKEVLVLGRGFHNIMASYFWYLPFASVRQCQYVMDKAKIPEPEDEWRSKRDDLEGEHKTPGAREFLRGGLKAWLGLNFYTQRRGKYVVLQKSTKTVVVDDA